LSRTDSDNDNSNENDDLLLEPAAEDMEKGKLPKGASMPVTDLYRRKHKTDSKSVRAPQSQFSFVQAAKSSCNECFSSESCIQHQDVFRLLFVVTQTFLNFLHRLIRCAQPSNENYFSPKEWQTPKVLETRQEI
jgi:hypothetical protein